MNPARAVPTFQRGVETISIHDTLSRALKIIEARDYSQFPVYEGRRFRGLLTENGVTRWLARHVSQSVSSVMLGDIPVSQVLQNEEERKNQAVLVTASGDETESLLGIATRWDILHLP